MDFAKVFEKATPLLLEGAAFTIKVSLISLLIGMILGLIACLMQLSKSKILKALSGVYIWIIRGTPMMVQAMLVYFGIPQIANLIIKAMADGGSFERFTLSPMSAAIITLSLNAGAYLAEIFRSGIQAVPKGQTEAARSLGLTKFKTMQKIVLPQAFKIVVPALVNQFIITIKDTSILSIIGLSEIVNKAGVYAGSTYQYFETYMYAALFYLVITSILMAVSKAIERRLNRGHKEQ